MRTTLCVVETCKIHEPGCGRSDCECPPAGAAPGLLVCAHHADTTRDRLREIPEFWTIIGAKPQGGRGAGSGEPPAPLSVVAMEARDHVRSLLIIWCQTLAKPAPEGRRSPLPTETTIAGNTRGDVLRHQGDAQAADHGAQAEARKKHPDHVRRLKLHQQAAMHRARADLARDARETGRDIVEALREHIDRHLAWLLNSRHADQLVHDVQAMHDIAIGAIPSRGPTIRILCDCGHRVPIDTESGAIITCPGCGEWGALAWWRRRSAPPLEGPMTLRQLPDWLFAVHGLIVTHKQLRNWHDRGHITQHNYVQRPACYDPEAVAVIAHHRLRRRAS